MDFWENFSFFSPHYIHSSSFVRNTLRNEISLLPLAFSRSHHKQCKVEFFPTSALYEILQFKIDTPHVSKWCGLSISIHTHTKSGGDHAATQDGVEGQKRCSFQEIHTAPLIVCKNSNEWKFHKCVICVNFYLIQCWHGSKWFKVRFNGWTGFLPWSSTRLTRIC